MAATVMVFARGERDGSVCLADVVYGILRIPYIHVLHDVAIHSQMVPPWMEWSWLQRFSLTSQGIMFIITLLYPVNMHECCDRTKARVMPIGTQF